MQNKNNLKKNSKQFVMQKMTIIDQKFQAKLNKNRKI